MEEILAPALDALSETMLAPYRLVEDAAPTPAFEFRVHLVRDVGDGRMVDYEIEGNLRLGRELAARLVRGHRRGQRDHPRGEPDAAADGSSRAGAEV